jgi:hypothetical protein
MERVAAFKVRAEQHALQTTAAIEALTTAGIDGCTMVQAQLQKREALGSTNSLNSKEDEGNDLEFSQKALTKALEDHRVSNEALGVAKGKLAEEKRKLTASQQSLTTVNLSLETSKTDLAKSKGVLNKTILEWGNTKKLLGKATSDLVKSRGTVRHYLAIFDQIYDSNMKGDMELTVGLAGTTTGWHAVRIKTNGLTNGRLKRRISSLST